MRNELIGKLMDDLGVSTNRKLREGEFITEVMVIMKTKSLVDDEPDSATILLADNGLDWVQRRGLLSATNDIFQAEPFKDEQ